MELAVEHRIVVASAAFVEQLEAEVASMVLEEQASEPLAVGAESAALEGPRQVLEALSELPKKLHKMDKTARLVPLLFCRKDKGFQLVQHPVLVWVTAVEEELEPVALAFASKGVVVAAAPAELLA